MSDSAVRREPTIHVRVRFHADLRRFLPPGHSGPLDVELRPPASVGQLLRQLGIPDEQMLTIGVNGQLGARETDLAAGDEVTLFSPMEGG